MITNIDVTVTHLDDYSGLDVTRTYTIPVDGDSIHFKTSGDEFRLSLDFDQSPRAMISFDSGNATIKDVKPWNYE